jgi:ribonuclease HI
MTASVDLWTASLCKPDPGYGGWAHVRRNADGTLAGAAGGERRVNGAKMVLTGVIEALIALADLPADTPVTLHFADPALAAELVASDGAYATAEPEAWAAARKLLAARPVLALSPLSGRDARRRLPAGLGRLRSRHRQDPGHVQGRDPQAQPAEIPRLDEPNAPPRSGRPSPRCRRRGCRPGSPCGSAP